MKILKPTLMKGTFAVIILISIYFFYVTKPFFPINCVPGTEDGCRKYAEQIRREVASKMTLFAGIPITILSYVLIGLIQSRRKIIK